jgi:hypothetical protein
MTKEAEIAYFNQLKKNKTPVKKTMHTQNESVYIYDCKCGCGGEEWFRIRLEPPNSILAQYQMKVRRKWWGKYLYTLDKKDREPIEVAISWYLRLRGFGDKRLMLTRYDYEQLKVVDNEIEHFLVTQHQFPLGTIEEWKQFYEDNKERVDKIHEEKTIEYKHLPRFCVICGEVEVYCDCMR